MGITLFSFGGLLAPLQSLIGWFAACALRRHARPAPATRAAAACTPARAAQPACAGRCAWFAWWRRCPAPSGAGRMVISGRMADVCAELDRLAELEAAAG